MVEPGVAEVFRSWSLRIHGIPQAQGRARAFPFIPKGQKKPRVRMYDPDTSRDWKRTITFLAANARPAELFTGPIYLSLTFYLPRPVSAPARVNQPTSKPDEENLGKAVKDAIRGVVYCDDCQIVWSETVKAYANTTDRPPGVQIDVHALAGEGPGDRLRARRMAAETRTPPPETSGRGRR